MNEVLELLRKGDFRGLFVVPTKNGLLQFVRYVFVGGIATALDIGVLFFLTDIAHLFYLISAVISFVVGLICNYVLSKKLVFKANETNVNVAIELISYALIGLIGLGFTEFIMLFLTDYMRLYYMLSKIIATIVVLVWNYTARKLFLYK